MTPWCRTKRIYRRLRQWYATDLTLSTHRLKDAKGAKSPPQSPPKTPKSPASTVPKLWKERTEDKEDIASKLDFASPHSGGAQV